MRKSVLIFLLLIVCSSITALVTAQKKQPPAASVETIMKGMPWRSIGPYRGGRVTAVTGVVSQPSTFYFGATGGGVWQTTDGGVNWHVISDGQLGTGSVGAIEVSQSDPNVIYLGMGEATIRGNVAHGDGLYKSTDSGKSWQQSGLTDTRHIFRVRVHPRNPDIVYVAALGHLFGPNNERGIFRSMDGGKSWQKVFSRGNRTGASDLIMDPSNPNTLYAGFWDVYRTPYSLESGGVNGGLFKSTDAGNNWIELTQNPGMPKGLIGNVGVTVSPVNPDRIWAIIEADEGGVFRSDDGGKTWSRTNEDRALRQRAWYYTRIYADTQNLDIVYVLNVEMHVSNDGGRTFKTISTPHGDNHDLWIAPNDRLRMIEGNDGGANVSYNGGKTWTELDQPTGQFYRVALDNDFPYHIYGAQQDNSTIKIASRTTGYAIRERDWSYVGGGESGWLAPHPKDSRIIFAGSYDGLLTRYDERTEQLRDITIWPDNPMGSGADVVKYRFQWNFPIVFSPHEPHALYAAGNVLFRSMDEGESWEAISPDLTRNDKSKQKPSGGPITKDNTSVEYYDTIFTLMESPVQKDLIWTGSDDGLVQLTRDGGKNWENVTPKNMPEWIQINSIEASPFDAGTAYIAATMYKSDDLRPYLYKTSDYGKSWQKIVNGIPEDAFTRVIREDPNRRGLLYAGTEKGIFVSFNDGKEWHSLQFNLPVVPITDLAVHKREKDLVAATQGRAFWILDDLSVLHQINDEVIRSDVQLFKPETSYRMPGGTFLPNPETNVGINPANGVVVYYYLKNKPVDKITMEFLDASDRVIKKLTGSPIKEDEKKATDSTNEKPEAAPVKSEVEREKEGLTEGEGDGDIKKDKLSFDAGLNRIVWNYRMDDATKVPGMILWGGSLDGPRVVPGIYQVRLTVNGKSQTQSFEIKKDPRISTTEQDFAKQYQLSLKIRDKLTETHNAILQIRDLRKQLEDLIKRAKQSTNSKALIEPAKSLNQRITAIEEALYQTKNRSEQDPLNFPIRLNNKLASLAETVDYDTAPTKQAYAVFDELVVKIDEQLQQLNRLVTTDLPAFNQQVRDLNVPALIVNKAEKN